MKSYTHILENRALSYIFYWIFPIIMLVLIRNESWSVNEYRAWRHMFVLLVLLFIIHGGDVITCSSWRSCLCINRLFKAIFTCCGRNFTTIDALPSGKSLPVLFARNATIWHFSSSGQLQLTWANYYANNLMLETKKSLNSFILS